MEEQSFIDYWDDLDKAMFRLFAIDTWDAGLDADCIATAQDDSQTPEDFALWFGEKYGLTPLSEV